MENEKKSISVKSAMITILVLFFVITGLVYLVQGRNTLIGVLLIVAGFTNALTLLSWLKLRNNLSVVVNIIFGGVALFTAYDYFLHKHRFLHFIWLLAALIYFLIALGSYLKVKKMKSNT